MYLPARICDRRIVENVPEKCFVVISLLFCSDINANSKQPTIWIFEQIKIQIQIFMLYHFNLFLFLFFSLYAVFLPLYSAVVRFDDHLSAACLSTNTDGFQWTLIIPRRRTRCNSKENIHKMGQQTFKKGNFLYSSSSFFFLSLPVYW